MSVPLLLYTPRAFCHRFARRRGFVHRTGSSRCFRRNITRNVLVHAARTARNRIYTFYAVRTDRCIRFDVAFAIV